MQSKRLYVALILLVCANLSSAQTASLNGRVLDESGAVISAAKIDVNGPAGLHRTISSGADGTFALTDVPPGNYTISASAAQLGMQAPQKITLRPGAQNLDLKLTVSVVAQKVTVDEDSGPATSIDPSGNASATVLSGDDLQALADDPEDLQADLEALAGPSAGPGGNQILIDGFTGGGVPPKESIREVRVNQNPFSPEFERLGLGRVEIFTKPGSEKYRGTFTYNYGGDWWNSRNPYAAEKGPLLLNEFENNIGGPPPCQHD